MNCKCCTSTSGTGCGTYCVKVNDLNGNSVSGISISIAGSSHSGTTTTPYSSSGTTSSGGVYCITPPMGTTITGATAYSPDPSCFASSGFSSGSVCYASFTFCADIIVVTTVDGATGGPISGVSLVGPYDLDTGQSCQTSTNTYEVVDGATHTFTTYQMLVAGTTNGCAEGPAINYVTACKEGYWGGCLGVGTYGTCGMTSYYTVPVWDQSLWNLNVQGNCTDDRSEVYPKTLCVQFTGPSQVFGGNTGTNIMVPWLSTSWDGDRFDSYTSGGYPNVMTYATCINANGAYGQCNGTVIPYSNAYIMITIRLYRGAPLMRVSYQPLWSTCDPNTDVAPTCLDSNGDRISAGPALYCPVPSPPNPPGEYFYQMPYVVSWSDPFWEGSSAVDGTFYNAPINLFGPARQGDGYINGFVNQCRINDPGNPDDALPDATVTVTENCSYSYGSGLSMLSLDKVDPYHVGEITQKGKQSSSTLVVARFNEWVDWTQDSPTETTILYNKGNALTLKGPETIELPNKGREAGSYLEWICTHYDSICDDDRIFFVQGQTHSGEELFGRMGVEYPGPTSLTWQYSSTFPSSEVKRLDLEEEHDGYAVAYGCAAFVGDRTPEVNGPWLMAVWDQWFECPPPDDWVFGYGAEWAVRGRHILQRPLSFWLWARDMVNRDEYQSELTVASAWAFEVIWLYLWSSPTIYPVRLPKGDR